MLRACIYTFLVLRVEIPTAPPYRPCGRGTYDLSARASRFSTSLAPPSSIDVLTFDVSVPLEWMTLMKPVSKAGGYLEARGLDLGNPSWEPVLLLSATRSTAGPRCPTCPFYVPWQFLSLESGEVFIREGVRFRSLQIVVVATVPKTRRNGDDRLAPLYTAPTRSIRNFMWERAERFCAPLH